MYKKLRNMVLILFAVLLVFMVSCAKYQEGLRTEEAKNAGMVAIDNDEKAFHEALKKGGKFFVAGPLIGHADVSKLNISAMSISGPQGENRKRDAERRLSGEYVYAAAEVCSFTERVDYINTGIKKLNTYTNTYEEEYTPRKSIVVHSRQEVKVAATDVTLFGVPVPLAADAWPESEMTIDGDIKHLDEEVVRLKTVESGKIAWLELEAKDGKIVDGSVRVLNDPNKIYDAQRVAGTASFLPVLIGIPIFLAIPLAFILVKLKRRYRD